MPPAADPAPLDPAAIDVMALERIASSGWPGTDTAEVGGWTLRAGGGFTGRANSALPPQEPDRDLDLQLAALVHWYTARALPAVVQVPLPARTDLADQLTARGWTAGHGAHVLVASCADVRARTPGQPELPAAQVSESPDPDWLGLYHYRGGELPAGAVDVLCAGTGVRFLTVRLDGTAVAVCRTAVAGGWVGLTAVEVAAAYRRRGLGTHLLREAVRTAGDEAAAAYLQVDTGNSRALAFYLGRGFRRHHSYRYVTAPRQRPAS